MKKTWINNLTVIITGASSGIGQATAKRLATLHNCKIIGVARNQERLEQTKKLIGENFSYYAFDVSSKDGWKDFKNYLITNNIYPDIILNNAGYLPKFGKAIYAATDAEKTINVNYLSAVYSLELFDILKQSKTPAIINISSSASLASVAGISAYCASKSAIRSFTEALSIENKSVYVGYIMPGCCQTQLFNESIKNTHDKGLLNKIASTPEKFAKKIVKRISKRKRRTVIGLDAKAMDFAYRLCPVLSLKIIAKVIKNAKLEDFKDIFED